jgi:hypothetical protein
VGNDGERPTAFDLLLSICHGGWFLSKNVYLIYYTPKMAFCQDGAGSFLRESDLFHPLNPPAHSQTSFFNFFQKRGCIFVKL